MAKKKICRVTFQSNLKIAKEMTVRALLQWAHGVGGELVNLTHRDAPSAKYPSLSGRGTPVDTGYLRNSMAYAVGGGKPMTETGSSYHDDARKQHGSYDGQAPKDSEGRTTIYVGSNVVYARRIEEGGRGYGGQHMCRNAVMDVKDFAKELLVEVLKANEI